MIITNSSVAMGSTHSLSVSRGTSFSLRSRPVNKESMQNYLGFYQNLLGNKNEARTDAVNRKEAINRGNPNIAQLRMLLLRRIFDALRGRNLAGAEGVSGQWTKAYEENLEASSGTVWELTRQSSSFYHEEELTTFQSVGYAETADGRCIEFGVELSMSRSFTSTFTSYETAQYFVTDPLVIGVSSDVTELSDFKFLFDLDQDGEAEEISFAGKGSGFLALDKNGDGIINDGGELFGTKSGDGFADLAEYDEDGNGWIDEADAIFSKLRVWTKDEEGKDQLIDLKSADVGAIYLGRAKTDFAMTDSYNTAKGFLRATGMYLKESGGAGTIAQVDLVS